MMQAAAIAELRIVGFHTLIMTFFKYEREERR